MVGCEEMDGACVCEERREMKKCRLYQYETGRRCARRFPLHEAELSESDGGEGGGENVESAAVRGISKRDKTPLSKYYRPGRTHPMWEKIKSFSSYYRRMT
jgi:hypothetical protein